MDSTYIRRIPSSVRAEGYVEKDKDPECYPLQSLSRFGSSAKLKGETSKCRFTSTLQESSAVRPGLGYFVGTVLRSHACRSVCLFVHCQSPLHPTCCPREMQNQATKDRNRSREEIKEEKVLKSEPETPPCRLFRQIAGLNRAERHMLRASASLRLKPNLSTQATIDEAFLVPR